MSSGSGSSSSSGDYCDWQIVDITYFLDNEMGFAIENIGTVDLIVHTIYGTIAAVIAPDSFPLTILPGGRQGVAFVSDSDLRGTSFYVETSCGNQSGIFPTGP